MEQYELKEMLTHVADGSVSVEEAVRRLKRAPFEEIGIASLDAHRGIRQGASEIVYGAGKTAAQVNKELLARGIFGGKDLSRNFPQYGQSALYAVTETVTAAQIDRLAAALAEIAGGERS